MVKHPRKELDALLTGSATFVEDLRVRDPAYIGFVRSPLAHARIAEIDTSAAKQTREVIGVFTRSELADLLVPGVWREFPLAAGEVVYRGQPVAVVAVSSRQALEDALEQVQVRYSPMQVVSDSAAALAGRRRWLSTASTNVILSRESRAGRPDETLKRAPHKLELELHIPRISPFSLEGRGMVVERWSNETVVYAPTQSPTLLQRFLLGSTANQGPVRVIQTAVGGAFGGKIFGHAEELACFLVSSKTGRNVKWIPLPEEKLVTLTHRPDQVHRLDVGYDESGRILALIDDVLVDAGAHYEGSAGGPMGDPGARLEHVSVPIDQMVSMFTGPYGILDARIKVTALATNKVMMGPIRGSGGMVATFVLERIMNQIALALRLDQFSVRRVNLSTADKASRISPFGAPLPSLRMEELLETASNHRASKGLVGGAPPGKGQKLSGVGISFYLAESAPPSAETARMQLSRTGKLRLFTSVAPTGQGADRTLADIVSKELAPGRSKVEVQFGDTTTSRPGVGTYSSRSIAYGGSAALVACRLLVDRIRARLEAEVKGALPPVTFAHGMFQLGMMDGTRRELDFVDAARRLGPVEVEATYSSESSTISSGCHMTLVQVDALTGTITVLRHLTFDDFGNVFDQSALNAQTEGGVLQSIGETLFESVVYDSRGRLSLPYTIPPPTSSPVFSHVPIRLTISQHIHGARGAGEAGRVGSLAAIVNAVENALSWSGNEVFLDSAPIESESAYRVLARA